MAKRDYMPKVEIDLGNGKAITVPNYSDAGNVEVFCRLNKISLASYELTVEACREFVLEMYKDAVICHETAEEKKKPNAEQYRKHALACCQHDRILALANLVWNWREADRQAKEKKEETK